MIHIIISLFLNIIIIKIHLFYRKTDESQYKFQQKNSQLIKKMGRYYIL